MAVDDPAHGCGGAACDPCDLPNAVPICAGSTCAIGACASGFLDCDGLLDNGCEVHADVDTANCGTCGNACSVANGVAGCSAGNCTIASCLPGFQDCNFVTQDGCEAALATDPKNCGTCGTNCIQGIACSGGLCAGNPCAPGHADCDGDVANGCETGTWADAKNCGGCGVMCPPGQSCTNSVCH